MKFIFSNDLHPLNKELISVIKDESKLDKSIDVIFSAFLSYSESKKWAKLSTGEENFIIIQEEFIFKGFWDKDIAEFSIKTSEILSLYLLISSSLYLKPFS